MRLRRPLAPISCGVFLLAAAPAADARYYMSEREAAHFMRDHLHQEGYYRTAVFCHPPYRQQADPRYDYHRWSCNWVTGNEGDESPTCQGKTIIIGSRKPGSYYYRNLGRSGPGC